MTSTAKNHLKVQVSRNIFPYCCRSIASVVHNYDDIWAENVTIKIWRHLEATKIVILMTTCIIVSYDILGNSRCNDQSSTKSAEQTVTNAIISSSPSRDKNVSRTRFYWSIKIWYGIVHAIINEMVLRVALRLVFTR